MNITKRTCGNCAHFNPNPAEDEPVCGNGLPGESGGSCDDHRTHAEDDLETALIAAGVRDGGLQGGIKAAKSMQARGAMRRDGLRLVTQ
jgi:hypothetical protein